jgi:hypothetical protein
MNMLLLEIVLQSMYEGSVAYTNGRFAIGSN